MSMIAAKRDAGRKPTHPGLMLRDEIIPHTGKTKTEIAELLDISRQQLYDIMNGERPISPTIAVRLGKLFGNGAGLWIRMQAAYDTYTAERDTEVSHIITLDLT